MITYSELIVARLPLCDLQNIFAPSHVLGVANTL